MLLNMSMVARDYKDLVTSWMEQIALDLSSENDAHVEMIRRASFLIRNREVQATEYNPLYEQLDLTISTGNQAYVTVDFFEKQLTCTCDYNLISSDETYCEHVVAAAMFLYQYQHSVQKWVADWRTKKTVQTQLIIQERTPAAWQSMAQAVVHSYAPKNHYIEPYLLTSIDARIHERLALHTPVEREWRLLYKLYMELYVLNALWPHIYDPNKNAGLMFTYFLSRKQDDIVSLMDDMGDGLKLFEMDAFFTNVEDMLHTLLLEQEGYDSERFAIYCHYWQYVQRNKTVRKREVERLANSTYDMHMIELFFALLLQDEDKIFAVKEHSAVYCSYYLELASIAYSVKSMRSYEHLLKLVLLDLEAYTNKYVPGAFHKIHAEKMMAMYAHISLNEQEEHMLYRALGAYGLQFYSMSLIQQQRYREWVALHMMKPTSLLDAEMSGLKDVLAHEPALLLPLYHVFALREVEQKSRSHYKQAVRIWKMMKSAAKKANKLAYFEQYIEAMQQQFKRLRALQEEMEKGKLFT